MLWRYFCPVEWKPAYPTFDVGTRNCAGNEAPTLVDAGLEDRRLCSSFSSSKHKMNSRPSFGILHRYWSTSPCLVPRAICGGNPEISSALVTTYHLSERWTCGGHLFIILDREFIHPKRHDSSILNTNDNPPMSNNVSAKNGKWLRYICCWLLLIPKFRGTL